MSTNFLTEAQAQAKFCHAIAQVTDGAGGVVAGSGTGVSIGSGPSVGRPACIASSCMAWRWYNEGTTGFCGRAGLPDRIS